MPKRASSDLYELAARIALAGFFYPAVATKQISVLVPHPVVKGVILHGLYNGSWPKVVLMYGMGPARRPYGL